MTYRTKPALLTDRRAAWSACAALAAACSGGGAKPTSLQSPPTAATVQSPLREAAAPTGTQPASEPPPPARAVRPFLQLARQADDQTDVLEPELVGVGQRVRSSATASLALEVDDVRLVLEPGGELWTWAEARSLLLVAGQLSVERLAAPAGVAPRPLRIATPHGAVLITGPSSLWLHSRIDAVNERHADGKGGARAQVALQRGSATLVTDGPDHVPQRVLLAAGAPLPHTVGPLQPLLIAAESGPAAVADRHRKLEHAFASARREPLGLGADAALERALAELMTQRARSQGLLARVAPGRGLRPIEASRPEQLQPEAAKRLAAKPEAPGARGDKRDVRAFHRDLVTQAQHREASRQLLLMAAEQSLLSTLAQCAAERVEPVGCPRLSAWTERFGGRLRDAL